MRQTKALRQPQAVFGWARRQSKGRSPSRQLPAEKRRRASLGSAPSSRGPREEQERCGGARARAATAAPASSAHVSLAAGASERSRRKLRAESDVARSGGGEVIAAVMRAMQDRHEPRAENAAAAREEALAVDVGASTEAELTHTVNVWRVEIEVRQLRKEEPLGRNAVAARRMSLLKMLHCETGPAILA